MPMRKASGLDDISTEIIVAAEVSSMMYKEGWFPEQRRDESVFIILAKVTGTGKCGKHRTISLMSHVTKQGVRQGGVALPHLFETSLQK